MANGDVAVGLLNTGNFGNRGTTFGDFNTSFTAHQIGLHCKGDVFTVRDLFGKRSLGVWKGDFWWEVDESTMLLMRASCVH